MGAVKKGAAISKARSSPQPKPNTKRANLNRSDLSTPTLNRPQPAHYVSGRCWHQSALMGIFAPIPALGRHQPMSLCPTASPPTPTINTDPIPESPLPSSTASTSDTAVSVLTTTAHDLDTPTDINPTTFNTSDVDVVHTCPHCDRTLTSHINLVGYL
ncbi:hypothetical protein SprV_0100463100 [Sparganum proliferum]